MKIQADNQTPEALLQAFSSTEYRVSISGREYIVRVGQAHGTLDRALRSRSWAIVTAFNPDARQSDDRSNLRRHRQLLAEITGQGRESYPAVNCAPGGDWPDEMSRLLIDAEPADLDRLARAFGQAAIVIGGAGTQAALRLYGRHWPQTLPDWAGRVN